MQTRREVRRLADDAALLRVPRSDQVADDDQPGSNSNAGLQGGARLDCGHRSDELKSRPYRPFGIVLVRARKAEINQHAVAMVLRNKPIEATHRFGDNVLIGQNDLTQIFRVHAGGKCRRTNKVREHHRDLPPLG